jgi:4'-phosphopantetheinyl transferase
MLASNYANVTVWSTTLEIGEEQYIRYLPLLSPYERGRAERFRQPEQRQRFVSARRQLRLILSQYLKQPPERIQIMHNQHGKPYIADSCLQFNLSHVNNDMLCAVSWEDDVGIDVEDTRRKIDIMTVVRTFFTPIELQQFEARSPEAQHALFFHLWTRKEAYLKARGVGLKSNLLKTSIPPEVSLFSAEDATQWSIVSFLPAPYLCAALVVAKTPLSMQFEALNP